MNSVPVHFFTWSINISTQHTGGWAKDGFVIGIKVYKQQPNVNNFCRILKGLCVCVCSGKLLSG
jgi:hypothetical protein